MARSPLPALPEGAEWPDEAMLQMAGGALALGRSYAPNDRVAGAMVRDVQNLDGGAFALRALDMLLGRGERAACARAARRWPWRLGPDLADRRRVADAAAVPVRGAAGQRVRVTGGDAVAAGLQNGCGVERLGRDRMMLPARRDFDCIAQRILAVRSHA